MATIESYKDLIVWQKAMNLVVSVYRLSRAFPVEERFGLTGQMRRAVVSIPSNIAEGYGRPNRSDYVRFLDIARGSANEVETQLLIAVRLGYVRQKQADHVMDATREVQRLLRGLVTGLERSGKTNVRRRS